MQHLSEEEQEELRAMLSAEKDSLEEELAEHGKKVGEDWQGTAAGFGAEEPDPIDAADALEELVINVPLVEELEKRYKEIVAAIKRMEDGSYGLTAGGEPIDIERLRANPAAQTNI
jgi:RNA polymerase-binding transcription factor DksA